MAHSTSDVQALHDEIRSLEERLQSARNKLKTHTDPLTPVFDTSFDHNVLHTLLLLSDSALPLGSFAFSNGLESYLAHMKDSPAPLGPRQAFHDFLRLSLSTLARTALPYVLAAYRNPSLFEQLDNDIDASTACTVTRRASVAQGRALLGVWDRSYRAQYSGDDDAATIVEQLVAFQTLLKNTLASTSNESSANGHLAPLWGVVTHLLHLPLHESAYLFLFSHARTVVSAAVRANVMGPYQAQTVLAATELKQEIWELVNSLWDVPVEDAGQTVPVMDLWAGRHEKLYSRIFNS